MFVPESNLFELLNESLTFLIKNAGPTDSVTSWFPLVISFGRALNVTKIGFLN
jgi:hypothetical protein